MISRAKGKYSKHIFTNVQDIINDFNKNQKKDSNRMRKALEPIISKLQKDNINELKDIAMIFKECGLDNKYTSGLIKYLLDKLCEVKIQKREINKFNKSYRNVIFTSFFHSFPDVIIQTIDYYVTNYCPNVHKHHFLLSKLKEQIENETEMKQSDINTEKIIIIENDNSGEISKIEKLFESEEFSNSNYVNEYFNEQNEDEDDIYF